MPPINLTSTIYQRTLWTRGFKGADSNINLEASAERFLRCSDRTAAGKDHAASAIICGILPISAKGRVDRRHGRYINDDYRAARSMIGLVRRNCIPKRSTTLWATTSFQPRLFGNREPGAYRKSRLRTCRSGTMKDYQDRHAVRRT